MAPTTSQRKRKKVRKITKHKKGKEAATSKRQHNPNPFHHHHGERWAQNDKGKERVDGANTQLAGFEQLKKYAVIPKALTEDDGLLTSTQKLKKNAVIERYQALWQKLY